MWDELGVRGNHGTPTSIFTMCLYLSWLSAWKMVFFKAGSDKRLEECFSLRMPVFYLMNGTDEHAKSGHFILGISHYPSPGHETCSAS